MVQAARFAEEAILILSTLIMDARSKKLPVKARLGDPEQYPKMVKMTEAVVKSVNKPVTVKTRLGYDNHMQDIVEIAERLQDVV